LTKEKKEKEGPSYGDITEMLKGAKKMAPVKMTSEMTDKEKALQKKR